jgi:hypothetical protein
MIKPSANSDQVNYNYKYKKYKLKYTELKNNSMRGGGGCGSLIKYGEVSNNIKHIGNFAVTDKILAGDSWNLELDMPRGMYSAYKSKYDLIIVHENNKNKINKNYLFDKIFNIIGDVGVDVGAYGFYDSGLINKIIPKKDNIMGGPDIPFFPMPDNKNDTMINMYMVNPKLKDYWLEEEDFARALRIKKKYPDLTFGVKSETGTGDGFFKCITNKTDGIAILLAHEY